MSRLTLSPATAARRPAVLLWAAVAAAVLAVSACGGGASAGTMGMGGTGQGGAAAANQNLDTGTPLGRVAAPQISLADQFGQQVSLSQFRGKVVILAFVDSECTTVCPLTTVSMTEAKQLLGSAGDQVQLLGVDANPQATAVSDVRSYSQAHAMVNQWDFLTGSLPQLQSVWKAYHIDAQVMGNEIDHTPALYVIDQQGREREIYLTSMAYASVGQEAQVLAQETASLLPGHPQLAHQGSLAFISGTTPASHVSLDAIPSGSVTLGPGQPRLVVFFATWLNQVSDLRAQLTGLNAYAQSAKASGLPALTAVDEAVSEPSPSSASTYLSQLGQPLDYPVAVDTTGRVADGYGVQDQPWFVLTNASGKIIWSHDGWLPVSALQAAAAKAGPS